MRVKGRKIDSLVIQGWVKLFDLNHAFQSLTPTPILFRDLPTLDAKKGYYFMIFFYIVDIDIKIIRLNKYTLEIHLKRLIYYSHFLYTKMVVKHKS